MIFHLLYYINYNSVYSFLNFFHYLVSFLSFLGMISSRHGKKYPFFPPIFFFFRAILTKKEDAKPMKKIIISLMLFSCTLFSGCKKQTPTPAPMEYVTSVEVSYDYRSQHLYRRYTDSDKMDVILFYLYDLKPYGMPTTEDPDDIIGDSCKITVHLSTGNKHVYRQRGSRYLSVDSHRWQKIKESQGTVLFHLVNHIQSD